MEDKMLSIGISSGTIRARGRLIELIDGGQPALLCSHWQGFYGMHDEDRRGFKTLVQVVSRLRERDPRAEFTRWRKCSEIGRYAACRALAQIASTQRTMDLRLPLLAPQLTLCIEGSEAILCRVGKFRDAAHQEFDIDYAASAA
jgi:hypothetical protein